MTNCCCFILNWGGGVGLKTHTRGVSLLGGGGLGRPSPENFEI